MTRLHDFPLEVRRTAWLQAALDLLAPPHCAGCGRLGSSWCRICRADTDTLDGELCRVCGDPSGDADCRHCASHASIFNEARSYAAYTPPFRHLIVRLKHRQDRSLGLAAAELSAPVLMACGWEIDLAFPVPLGENRLRKRGYNQVTMFGKPLSAALGIPFRTDALRRTRDTRSQVGLTGDQRRANLRSAFEAAPAVVSGKSILLLDDVFTTGATGNACAGALFKSGAAAVRMFTLARAVPELEPRREDAP